MEDYGQTKKVERIVVMCMLLLVAVVAVAIVSNTKQRRVYDYDIAVICALKEEADFISAMLNDVCPVKVDYDNDIYKEGYFEKEDKNVLKSFLFSIL